MNVAEVTATVGFLFDYWNRDNSTIMYSKLKAVKSVLTDMQERVPTNEFAIESISCPLTPKSQSLISPLEFTKMLDGLTSGKK